MPPTATLLAWTLTTAFLALGALLLKRGRYPRRVGDTPHCPACGYVLTGITSANCPECGRPLSPATIIRGDRPRHPALTLAGVVLLTLSLLTAGVLIQRRLAAIDWYHYRPFAWLMRDLHDPAANPAAPRAWDELRRRADAALLADAQRDQFIQRLLDEQDAPATTSLTKPLLSELVARAYAGQLKPAERARFIASATRMSLTVPPTGTQNTPLPYRITCTGRAGPDIAWLQNTRLTMFLNDGPLPAYAEEHTGWGLGLANFSGRLPPLPPGHYRLRAALETRVGENEVLLFSNDTTDQPDAQLLTADFDVTP